MKLATDTWMLRSRSVRGVFEAVAEAGYRYLEWSPRDDFLPSYAGRRASREAVEEARSASRDTGVEVASVFLEYASASSDESIRTATERYWKQAIEITAELGCTRINAELTGHPAHPHEGEAALLKTLDEILPVCERAGVTIAMEPHPGDFIESGIGAVDFIRGIRSPNLVYLHCVPHAFYLGIDPRTAAGYIGRPFTNDGEIIRYAGDTLDHVHMADTFRPERIFLNPYVPGVRVHSHNDIGTGEIDWPDVFSGLRDVGFDGVMTVTVFRQEQRVIDSLRFNRAKVEELLAAAG
jgi:myo-inositol catabolism protein IolH